MDDRIDVEAIAEACEGFSGADLGALVKDAATHALKVCSLLTAGPLPSTYAKDMNAHAGLSLQIHCHVCTDFDNFKHRSRDPILIGSSSWCW